jgi:hypothetical protein
MSSAIAEPARKRPGINQKSYGTTSKQWHCLFNSDSALTVPFVYFIYVREDMWGKIRGKA